MRGVQVDTTRREIRHAFMKWDIDPSEFEIVWESEEVKGGTHQRLPGAKVRYLRNGSWQEVSCYAFHSRSENLRQCFLLLDRLRIAEQHGVQYVGLTHTKEVARVDSQQSKREAVLDAYDILGVSPDDPIELVKDVYRKKSMYFHPDKGGDAEKFKRLNTAYEAVMKSRNVNP